MNGATEYGEITSEVSSVVCGFAGDAGAKVSFAEALTAQRVERMMTVAEMAAAIHTPHRTVESWMHATRVPDAQTQAAALDAIAKAPPSAAKQREMQRLHGLTWDKSKRRWKLRLTLDMGKKVVGKRITVALKTANEAAAIQKRDGIVEAYRRIGLTVRGRGLKRGATPFGRAD